MGFEFGSILFLWGLEVDKEKHRRKIAFSCAEERHMEMNQYNNIMGS
jgi:hypothetical protein